MSIELNSLLTEIILNDSLQPIDKIYLDWMPQPGNQLELNGKTFIVLERHHHYHYSIGGYCLSKISLHVQESPRLYEQSLVKGRWVLGNAECRYNAHSEMICCAVNPQGSCQDCSSYESRENKS